MKVRKRAVKKQSFSFSEAWRDSLRYLNESKYFIYISVLIFVFSGAVSFLFPNSFTFFNEMIKELLAQTQGKNGYELVWFIFSNNISSAFFAVFLGAFIAVFPILNAVINGLLLGYVLALTNEAAGILSFWRLLPHGIFELPAIFISIGMGIKFGMFIFAKQRKEEFLYRFYNSLKVFFMIVLPLLIMAAIIEGLLIRFFS